MERSIAIKCPKHIQLNSLKEVTQALVLSYLGCCPAIWSSSKVQKPQNRLVLQCSECVTEMHTNLSWFYVENRRKVLIDEWPQHFYDCVIYARHGHNHMSRQASSGYIEPPKPRTELLESSVINRAITEWNSPPSYIKNTSADFHFKKMLKQRLMQ